MLLRPSVYCQWCNLVIPFVDLLEGYSGSVILCLSEIRYPKLLPTCKLNGFYVRSIFNDYGSEVRVFKTKLTRLLLRVHTH